MKTIPEKCPFCAADLTGDGSLEERDLLPVTYGGRRTDSGYWENDGNGFDWHDQSGRSSHICCIGCDGTVAGPDEIRVGRRTIDEIDELALDLLPFAELHSGPGQMWPRRAVERLQAIVAAIKEEAAWTRSAE